MPGHRFYLDPASWNPDALELAGEEAHHCRDVVRCAPGELVSLFDGMGRERRAVITEISKKLIRLEPVDKVTTSPRPAQIALGQAIPKGKNMELIIQKATELGVSEVAPVISDRTIVQLNENDLAKKQEKWQRIAIEACKQCGQNWLPRIAAPQTLPRYLESSAHDFRVIAALTDQARPLKELFSRFGPRATPAAVNLLIGPEGDFTPEEVQRSIAAGYQPVSLGPIVLRSETAAIFLLSIMAYELNPVLSKAPASH